MEGATRGKPGPAGIGGVLLNNEGIVLALFSKHVGCIESGEAEVVAILEAIRIFTSSSYRSRLVVECDSLEGVFFGYISLEISVRFE